MCSGRAEQNAIRDDAGAASADFQHPQEQGEEQQLSLFGLAELEQVGGNNVVVQTALEWGICQNQAVSVLVGVLVAQAVAVLDERVVHAVGHHVHSADAQHGAVHIEAVEHVVHVVVFVFAVKEHFLLAVFTQIFASGHKEARRAAGRVANHIISAGLHQVNHHADDVAWGAELTVDTRRCQLGKQVFVDVAANVGVGKLCRLLIHSVHGSHDFIQHQRRGHFENGITHVLGVGTVLVAVQILDEGEHHLLHGGVHFACREIVENAPLELCSIHSALPDLYLARKDALVGQTQHSGFFGVGVVAFIEVVNEHQIGHLLDHIQGIRQAARPENFPQAVNFAFQFSGYHVCSSCVSRK